MRLPPAAPPREAEGVLLAITSQPARAGCASWCHWDWRANCAAEACRACVGCGPPPPPPPLPPPLPPSLPSPTPSAPRTAADACERSCASRTQCAQPRCAACASCAPPPPPPPPPHAPACFLGAEVVRSSATTAHLLLDAYQPFAELSLDFHAASPSLRVSLLSDGGVHNKLVSPRPSAEAAVLRFALLPLPRGAAHDRYADRVALQLRGEWSAPRVRCVDSGAPLAPPLAPRRPSPPPPPRPRAPPPVARRLRGCAGVRLRVDDDWGAGCRASVLVEGEWVEGGHIGVPLDGAEVHVAGLLHAEEVAPDDPALERHADASSLLVLRLLPRPAAGQSVSFTLRGAYSGAIGSTLLCDFAARRDESAEAAEVTPYAAPASTLLLAPPAAAPLACGDVNISWQPAAAASAAALFLRDPTLRLAATSHGAATSHTLSGLAPPREYRFAVRLKDEATGLWGAMSDFTPPLRPSLAAITPPPPPSALRLELRAPPPLSCASLGAAWRPADGCRAVEYQLRLSFADGSEWHATSASPNATLSPLPAAQCYPLHRLTLAVRGRGAAGWGAYSAPIAFTLGAREPPAAPAALSAAAAHGECGALTLRWQPPARSGGVPLDEYRVLVDDGAAVRAVGGLADAELRVRGLRAGANCSFSVFARNVFGWSEESARLTVAIHPLLPLLPPPRPTVLPAQCDAAFGVALRLPPLRRAGCSSDDFLSLEYRASPYPSPSSYPYPSSSSSAAAAAAPWVAFPARLTREELRLEHLDARTPHEFRLRAHRAAAASEPSESTGPRVACAAALLVGVACAGWRAAAAWRHARRDADECGRGEGSAKALFAIAEDDELDDDDAALASAFLRARSLEWDDGEPESV